MVVIGDGQLRALVFDQNAGIVHEAVKTTRGFHQSPKCLIDAFFVGDVALKRQECCLLRRVFRQLAAARQATDREAAPAELTRDFSADATARTGDRDDFAVLSHL